MNEDTSILRGVAYITIEMKIAGSRDFSSKQLTILIVAALFCLCISDSVGLRLLPLPNLPIAGSFAHTLNSVLVAPRVPSPLKERNEYVQMLGGSQYRTRDRHHDVQPATHVPGGLPLLPLRLLAFGPAVDSSLNFKPPSLAIPTGRAPPI